MSDPPYCAHCGASARGSFIQHGETPFGICGLCRELVQLVPLMRDGRPTGELAPFLRPLSRLQAPAALVQARTEIQLTGHLPRGAVAFKRGESA